MSRKNNALQTKEKIVEAAIQLFMEKGFEKTSIQDIADTLGISKGGIYHHFRSKEDIIRAVSEMKENSVEQNFRHLMESIDARSAREKLTAILQKNIADQDAHAMDEVFSTQVKSADFIVSMMKNSVETSAPIFAEIIKEGIEDGSIQTKYPDEIAEVFLLLMNVWCDPVIFQSDEKKLYRRMKFVQAMMRQLGVDIVTDALVHETIAMLNKLYAGEQDDNK